MYIRRKKIMKKLKLEHLVPYLPYALFGMFMGKRDIVHEVELENGLITGLNSNTVELKNFKPILRPLSDLTMQFYWDNLKEGDFEIDEDRIKEILSTPRGQRKYYQTLYLFKHYFDVFGLIDKGLAIDINSLKNR